MIKNKSFYIATLLLLTNYCYSQPDLYFNQYMMNSLHFNPAYAGSSEMKNSDISARYERPGIPMSRAPIRFSFIADGVSESMHGGLGGFLSFAHVDTFSTFLSNLSYCYKIKSEGSSSYRLGLSLGNYILVHNPTNDPFSIKDSLKLKNMKLKSGIGFLYKYEDLFYASISINRMFIDFKTMKKPKFTGDAYFYLSSGYTYKVTESVSLTPSFMIRGGGNTILDAGVVAKFLGWLLVGIGKADDSMFFLLGFQTEKLRASFTYENQPSLMGTSKSGAIEMNANARYE